MSLTPGGIAHEKRSQALSHTGPVAERHLRTAVSLYDTAISLEPSAKASLRLATALYHLSPHCRPAEAIDLLRKARLTILGQETVAAFEARAAICTRLSSLLRKPKDTLWDSEAGECASDALDALEDVAADRMDYASTLSKSDFERETPALAATFLALAEAAGAVCTLAPEVEDADVHVELVDHALAHAANMATLSRAPALVTHVQITSARLAAERLQYYARYDEDVGWDELLSEMCTLAMQTRDRAQRLRGTRGAAAAEQASEAVKLLADVRVMYAQCLGMERPISPNSHRSGPTAPTTPLSGSIFAPQSVVGVWPPSPPHDPTPGLSSSSGSWTSSTDSPPIPEEDEDVEEEDDKSAGEAFSPPSAPENIPAAQPPSPTGRKRAPPPPPLKLVQTRSPRLMQPLTPLHPPPLSPLNPARRASDLPPRPRLVRGPSFNSPRRASWMSPSLSPALEPGPMSPQAPGVSSPSNAPTPPLSVAQQQWNQLAAAGKGYKLALNILSSASMTPSERARRKSELLFAVAATALARAEIAPHVALPTPGLPGATWPGASRSEGGHTRASSGSYFSPTAPHASPESIQSLHKLFPASPRWSSQSQSMHVHSGSHSSGHARHHSFSHPRSSSSRIVPATPRPDPRSGTRTTGAAALRATAEVYAAWAAREVGWSAVIDPKSAGADRRTGSAGADEAGLRAALLAIRVCWVRAKAGDFDSDVHEESHSESESARSDKGKARAVEDTPNGEDELGDLTNTFGLPVPSARHIGDILARLRLEGAGTDDVRRFIAPFTVGEVEKDFWSKVVDILG